MKQNPAQYAADLKKRNGLVDALRIASNCYANSGDPKTGAVHQLEPMYRGHETDRSAASKNARAAKSTFAFWQNVNGILKNELERSKGKKK